MVGMAPVAAVPHMYSPLRYLTPVAREVRITFIITMLIIFVTIIITILIMIIIISLSECCLWPANMSLPHETAYSPTSLKHFATRLYRHEDYQDDEKSNVYQSKS